MVKLTKGIRESILPVSWLSPDAKSINVKNSLGYTLLHIASFHGHVEFVADLLDKLATRAIPDNQGYNALHWAASEGHTFVCRKLLEKDLSAKTKDYSLLNSQAQAFNEEGIEFGFKRTPLHRAAWHGRADTVQFFIEAGANVNAQTSAQNGCGLHYMKPLNKKKTMWSSRYSNAIGLTSKPSMRKAEPLSIMRSFNDAQTMQRKLCSTPLTKKGKIPKIPTASNRFSPSPKMKVSKASSANCSAGVITKYRQLTHDFNIW